MSLFIRKPLEQLLAQSADSGKGLKRTLGPGNLIALGIGAIIGAGLFVRTAAAASQAAGPGVVVSYIIGGVGCAFAGLCYAEFASMIPIAGSAYAYAYVTMGEFIAWVIGWALILEYALAGATVAIAWSEYLNSLLGGAIPYEWCHSPWEASAAGVSGIINLPAIGILILVTLILIKGTQESAAVNAVIVFIKVSIVLVVIAVGWGFINEANYTPFIIPEGTVGHEGWNQHGWGGVIGGAGIVFFAFIGFDAVSTAAQEAKNPKRDMPIGILGSLVVCTILFVLFSHVLTGVANWQEFKVAGKEASVAYAIKTYMHGYEWLATAVTVAILAGFTSVILVMLMGQSRVFFSMSKDGLVPRVFSEIHPKFRTPFKSNAILFFCVAPFAGFVPGDIVGDLTSFGTLFAFVLVCAGIWVMRVKNPEAVRPFKTPLVPLVPILGMIICSMLILALDDNTKLMALGWMVVGLFIYFLYGKNHSLLRSGKTDSN
ncbi:MAG: amino acid permease [Bacteroidetes bacterium]|nr:amino acid permease [Bacteroidota bacterium]